MKKEKFLKLTYENLKEDKYFGGIKIEREDLTIMEVIFMLEYTKARMIQMMLDNAENSVIKQ